MVQQTPATDQLQEGQGPAAPRRTFKAGDRIEVTGAHIFKGRIGTFRRHDIRKTLTGTVSTGKCFVSLDKIGDETKTKEVQLDVADIDLHPALPSEDQSALLVNGSGQVVEAPASLQHGEDAPTVLVSLMDIVQDPNQPRKTFPEGEIQELAASMVMHGQLQSVMLRPAQGQEGKYMIVFGEKRCRAAQVNEWAQISASIRQLSDDDVLEIQVIENLQRSDVHALQEAHAFQTLHKRLTLEQIADRIGKSKKYVSVRLRLNELTPDWQELYMADRMSFEDAKILSRATRETQLHVFNEKAENWKDNEDWKLMHYQYLLKQADHDLDSARFKTEDPDLYPEMGACGTCPHNSAFNQLFGDVEGRICNFSPCYKIKTERGYAQRLQEVLEETDTIMIAGDSYHAPQADMKAKAAAEAGGTVLKSADWVEATLEAEPIYEEFKKAYDDYDEPFSETEVKQEFDEEHQRWEAEKVAYEQAQAEGRIKKAFVVSGSGAGTYKNIVLKENAAATITNDVAGKIQKLVEQEAKAKIEDAILVYKDSMQLLKYHESFINNSGPLKAAETVALVVMIMGSANETSKTWLENQLGYGSDELPGRPTRIELVERMQTHMTGEMVNQFIRKALTERLISTYDCNTEVSPAPKAMLNIATIYLPEDVARLQSRQNKIAEERSWEVQEKITQLKLSAVLEDSLKNPENPLPIRTDTTMMAIKVCPPDSNRGWRKLEGGFNDVDTMEKRFQELLASGKYFEEVPTQA